MIPEALRDIEGIEQYSPELKHGYVYFLVNKDKIVYIGQTTHLRNRIRQHKRSRKNFDSAYSIRIPKDRLTAVEGEFIQKYRPHYNQMHNGDSDVVVGRYPLNVKPLRIGAVKLIRHPQGWDAEWSDADGRICSLSLNVTTKEAASSLAREINRRLRNGRPIPDSNELKKCVSNKAIPQVTFEELAEAIALLDR